MEISTGSRQPQRQPWSRERFLHERAIAIGFAIDKSTAKSYGSALNSYLTFVQIHNLPAEPTEETLSFYTVFMCHHIKPDSVDSYLSGIIHQLEPYFPNVREIRNSYLVTRTLRGCKRMMGSAIKRKRALTLDDLQRVIDFYSTSTTHDDLLFVSMLLTGFFALMRLGELSFPNDKSIQDWRKVTKRSSVTINPDQYEFFMPGHKADRYFEGNRIIVRKEQFRHNPLHHFQTYISSRDRLFPLASPLWITFHGDVPTRSFFIQRLRTFFDNSVAGQSMRAGGATSLAENGVPPSIIQPLGRWSSPAFLVYIRKNPALIQALLYARSRPSGTPSI
jgi:hypothetical protein